MKNAFKSPFLDIGDKILAVDVLKYQVIPQNKCSYL
jgi:hypothetical protein